RSTSVVFPVPDGADTMNSSPRRAGPASRDAPAGALLNVLHLFAHLFELGLRRNDQLGDPQAVRLPAARIDLAVHLLQQEIELAAARLVAVAQDAPMRHVGPEPRDLFADIRSARRADDLLGDHRLIHRQLLADFPHALMEPGLECGPPLLRGFAQTLD